MKDHSHRTDSGGTTGKRLKIALLVHCLAGGGAEKVMVNLANFFAGEGHRAWLITTRRGVYFDQISPSVMLHLLPFRRFSRNLLPLSWFLTRRKPDVLLATLEPANLLAPRSRRLALSKTKIILREANTFERFMSKDLTDERKNRKLAKLRSAFHAADAVIANSPDIAGDLKEFSIIDSRCPLDIIPNPTYTSRHETLALQRCRHPWVASGEPYVLNVGSLTPQKDQETLIRSVSKLQARHKIKLIVLGTGSEEARLQALIEEEGLSDMVSLAGFHENPFPFYKNARLFCLSSRWEGQPNVLIEALGMGLPVVSTDCKGGANYLLAGGKYGCLVPVGDHDAMANAIADILGKRYVFPKEAQKERAAEFSIENSGRKYLDFIESVINN